MLNKYVYLCIYVSFCQAFQEPIIPLKFGMFGGRQQRPQQYRDTTNMILGFGHGEMAFITSVPRPCHLYVPFKLPSHSRSLVALALSSNTLEKKSVQEVEIKTARNEALRALVPKRKNLAFAVDRLESSQTYKSLPSIDRAFARLLVSTVERRQGQIDKILQQFQSEQQQEGKLQQKPSRKKPKSTKTSRIDQYVQGVLRLGVAQLLFLQTPHHAACKETVDLLRLSQDFVVSEGKIKFVNAVLRGISRADLEGLENTTSITDNVAPWLLEEWNQAWGHERTMKIVEQAMQPSPIVLTVVQKSHDMQDRNEVVQQIVTELTTAGNATVEMLAQKSIQLRVPPKGAVSKWPGFHEGKWFVQDASATLPAIALYNTLSNQGTTSVVGTQVVDLCAAPGGKTFQLCSHGFSVTAVEKSSKRSTRLRQNLDRLGLECNVVVADGTQWRPDDSTSTPIQGVLLDVPCTATGTGSRRPDVLRRDSNYSDLLATQFDLACHAVDNIISVGGVLVYATCSLLRQEGEDQMNRLVDRCNISKKSDARLEIIPFDLEEVWNIPGCTIDPNGWLRVFPQTDNQMDGFFVGRVRKV